MSDDASPQSSTRVGHPDRPVVGLRPLHAQLLPYLTAALASLGAGFLLTRLPGSLLFGGLLAILMGLAIAARPFVGLLLYSAIFLVRPAELHPILAPLHLERIVGLVTLLSLVVQQIWITKSMMIDNSRQSLLLMAFLAVALVSIPFAYWRSGAVDSFMEMLKILVFYVLVVHLVSTRERLRIFVYLFCFLIVYISASSFLGYLQGQSSYSQGIERAVGATNVSNNANTLGTTLAATVPLVLLLAARRLVLWLRLSFLSMTVLFVVTMAVTGSRASLLGFIGGMIALWWNSKRRVLLGICGLLILAGGFQFLPEQYQERYASIGRSEIDGSSRGRIEAWKAGMDMLVDHPLLGVGIGCFSTAHHDYRGRWLSPHNLYVQVFSETGLIGTTLFLLLLYQFLVLNRRTARMIQGAQEDWSFELAVLKGLFAGFVVLLITGVFGHSLLRRTWYIYAATGLAINRIWLAHNWAKPPSVGSEGSQAISPGRSSDPARGSS